MLRHRTIIDQLSTRNAINATLLTPQECVHHPQAFLPPQITPYILRTVSSFWCGMTKQEGVNLDTLSFDPSMTAVDTTPHHHDMEPNSSGSVTDVKNVSHRTAITSVSSSHTESFGNQNANTSANMVLTTMQCLPDDKSLSDQVYFGEVRLEPPISTMERSRDVILRTLDRPMFQYIGLVVMLGVVIDGAIFFFLLIGLHTLCHPVTDCEPRNTMYNISIQILNGFFTYMAILSLPWRLSNFLHLSRTVRNRLYCCCGCRSGYPQRSNEIGHNLYGLPDTDIWFHIPVQRRCHITTLLLCNCLFQFINHGTRIVHSTYEEQDAYPGNVWTNVFFVSAFACAGTGASWILYETSQLRKQHPTKFGHGPIDAINHWYHHHFLRWLQHHLSQRKSPTKKMKKNETNILDENSDIEGMSEKIGEIEHGEIEVAFHHRERNSADEQHPPNNGTLPDPTRAMNHPAVLLEDRGALRMFGM